MTRRYALRDDQWERIKDLLPGREGYVGVTAFIQSVVCRSGVVPLPGWNTLARLAKAIWGFPRDSHPLQSVVKNGRVGAGVSALGQ